MNTYYIHIGSHCQVSSSVNINSRRAMFTLRGIRAESRCMRFAFQTARSICRLEALHTARLQCTTLIHAVPLGMCIISIHQATELPYNDFFRTNPAAVSRSDAEWPGHEISTVSPACLCRRFRQFRLPSD
jgi:hypothetical protein